MSNLIGEAYSLEGYLMAKVTPLKKNESAAMCEGLMDTEIIMAALVWLLESTDDRFSNRSDRAYKDALIDSLLYRAGLES